MTNGEEASLKFVRMPIEIESPEQLGYDTIRCNLSESSVSDRRLRDLNVDLDDVLLCYGDHKGSIDLRDTVAKLGSGLDAEDVLITAGASSALFMVATSLLTPEHHLVVVRPNYATNIETPRAIGCEISFIDLDFEAGFRLDLDKIEAAIRPNTKYVSITYPHNPSGVMLTEAELRAVVALVERKGCLLLFDETYREMTFGPMLPVAASLSPSVISVSSLSKTYGIPGIRIGWLICRDPKLMQLFLAAKEQIGISGSMIDEYVGYVALQRRDEWIEPNNRLIRKGFDLVKAWIERDEFMEWVQPEGGCVCLPRIRPDVKIDLPKFYDRLYSAHGTYVGAGRWFEMPDNYFRVGFGWPTLPQLSEGLEGISAAIRDAMK
jgi:aspartate/methionine/tyrosine aminotransferase